MMPPVGGGAAPLRLAAWDRVVCRLPAFHAELIMRPRIFRRAFAV